MWTLSAIAKVMIIVGATADGGVSGIPSHPIKPIPIIVLIATTNTPASIPTHVLSIQTMNPNMPTYINGIRVDMSRMLASANA